MTRIAVSRCNLHGTPLMGNGAKCRYCAGEPLPDFLTPRPIETREDERQRLERHARLEWLGRVEKALWRMHKHAEFDSWEEQHYYGGLAYIIAHRTNNDGY